MKKTKENFLDKKPICKQGIDWSYEDGLVTLHIENKGVFNFLAQKLLKKPRISHIHMEQTGSFLWPLFDGEKTVFELGKELKQEFGDEVEPLYERLVPFIKTLETYKFIELK